MRIKDLPADASPGGSDYLALDSAADGTRKSTLDQLLAGVNADIDTIEEYLPVEVKISAVSSLPVTVSNADINGDLDVDCFILSNPAAMVSAWTITTATGSPNGTLTISGTIASSSSTDVYIKLSKPYKTIT